MTDSALAPRTFDLCAGLTKKERELLAALGRKIVLQQVLTPDVHAGYRKL